MSVSDITGTNGKILTQFLPGNVGSNAASAFFCAGSSGQINANPIVAGQAFGLFWANGPPLPAPVGISKVDNVPIQVTGAGVINGSAITLPAIGLYEVALAGSLSTTNGADIGTIGMAIALGPDALHLDQYESSACFVFLTTISPTVVFPMSRTVIIETTAANTVMALISSVQNDMPHGLKLTGLSAVSVAIRQLA